MVKKFNKEQGKFGLPLSCDQAIEFAKLFDFMAEVKSSTYFLEESQQPPVSQKRVFVVPPMLSLNLPDDPKLPDDKNAQARVVYFNFPDKFIPPMVFYQMLTSCIHRNIKREENLYWIRRHMIKMVLGYDQLYYVSLCEDRHSIRLAITPDEDGVVTIQGVRERWKLIEEFNAKLKETVKAFMPASQLPQCFIPCTLCAKLHLKLDDIRANDRPLHCINGKLLKDYYSDLRQYQDISEADGATVTAAADFTKISQKVPTIQKMGIYLEKILNWEAFGYQLLPEDKEHLVEEIKRDSELKGTASCKIVLYRTFLKCGINTWEQVIKALHNSDHDKIAEHVKLQLLINYGKESTANSNKSQEEATSTKIVESQSLPHKPISSQVEAQSLPREHQPSSLEPQLLSEDSSTSNKDALKMAAEPKNAVVSRNRRKCIIY